MGSLNHVLRRMAKAPGFTAVALTTLALGIGATTAIFSVIEGVLIKPLPFPHAENLVGVWHLAPGVKGVSGDLNCSPTMYFTYREENKTFQDFGLWENGGGTVTGLGEPEALPALSVTYGLLEALDVPPALGRWFSGADDTPGTPETVILSYGYWQRRFGGSASAIGRTLTVDSRPRLIIGVMPKNFRFLNSNADLIFPGAAGPRQALPWTIQLSGHRPLETGRLHSAGQRRRRANAANVVEILAAASRIEPHTL
ncbi:MAG TPA: ABC transporter permease [Bryobacteraceae bacterium]